MKSLPVNSEGLTRLLADTEQLLGERLCVREVATHQDRANDSLDQKDTIRIREAVEAAD